MPTIKQFDRTNLKEIREQIEQALLSVSQKYKIAFKVGSMTFSDNEFRAKLEAVIQSSNSSGMSVKQIQALENVKKYGFMFNIKETDLGKTFTSNGDTFKFVGIMPNRPKFPILGEDVNNGKLYKFNEEIVKRFTDK